MAKEMVRVPADEFMMGALDDDEEALMIMKTASQGDPDSRFLDGEICGDTGVVGKCDGVKSECSKGANRPVECVSWFDVVSFSNKLSELEGLEPVYDGLGDYQVQNMDEDEIESLSDGMRCKRVSIANGGRV